MVSAVMTMTGWMWIWPVLILIGLAIFTYLGISLAQGRLGQRNGDRHDDAGQLSARRILDERYARGEIDEEEYRRRRTEPEQ